MDDFELYIREVIHPIHAMPFEMSHCPIRQVIHMSHWPAAWSSRWTMVSAMQVKILY